MDGNLAMANQLELHHDNPPLSRTQRLEQHILMAAKFYGCRVELVIEQNTVYKNNVIVYAKPFYESPYIFVKEECFHAIKSESIEKKYLLAQENVWMRFVKESKFHTDYNWIMLLWKKFRDLKFNYEDKESNYYHEQHCRRFKDSIVRDELIDCFYELIQGIGWFTK